jgi:hypothetical protein
MSSRIMIKQSPYVFGIVYELWSEANPEGTPKDAFQAAIDYVAHLEFGYDEPDWLYGNEKSNYSD